MAPRPLLIANTDKDTIFPLDGVYAVHQKVRRVYELLDAGDRLGLQITEGPHKDTQELRVHAFRWFNRFLRNDDSLIRVPAEPLVKQGDLKVFTELPENERTSVIHESFVPQALLPAVPPNREAWNRLKSAWMTLLKTKAFAGWPEEGEETPLPALVRLVFKGDDSVEVQLVDVGQWAREPKKAHHLRRRFMLLGQTLDGMRVWDLVRQLDPLEKPVRLAGHGQASAIALYASLFSDNVASLHLHNLPADHRNGPIFLNVTKYLNIPQALAMAGERCAVRLVTGPVGGRNRGVARFARATLEMLGFPGDRMDGGRLE